MLAAWRSWGRGGGLKMGFFGLGEIKSSVSGVVVVVRGSKNEGWDGCGDGDGDGRGCGVEA